MFTWYKSCSESAMSDAHVRAFRLFDLAQSPKKLGLLSWEQEHLDGCEECQEVLAVYVRQVTYRPPTFNNGQPSPEDSFYATVCCGWEMFVPAGKVFPDCKRHKNLSTAWKKVEVEQKRSA